MRRFAIGTAAVTAMLMLGAWGSATRGDGQSKTESRSLNGFNGVANETSLAVEVSQGAAFEVSVTGDSNLLPLIRTEVSNGTLRIFTKDDISPVATSSVRVVVPSLERAVLAGSGSLRVHGINGNGPMDLRLSGSGELDYEGTAGETKITAAGSGNLKAAGKASGLAIDVAGSGNVDAAALAATSAKVSVAGSGDVKLAVNGDAELSTVGSGSIRGTFNGGKLDVTALGSGDVVWSGTSKLGKSSVLGSGRIKHE